MKSATLYFHYPCFDGLVSAVLAWEFLEHSEKWHVSEFVPVNYKLRDRWLKDKLQKPCAIVDYLYHPRADFWADHHQTSMLTARVRANFEKRKKKEKWLMFDERAPSCATLLFRHLRGSLKHKPHFQEMVYWAEKIDSASFTSVHEAILGDAPALRIGRSLLMEEEANGPGYAYFLLQQMRAHDLNYVAGLREVKQREQKARRTLERGLKRATAAARMKQGVVVMDVNRSRDQMISRYAPYFAQPNARYSIGIVRAPDSIGITAMRNPWRKFKSVSLGRVFEKFGGGGHQRVGAVRLSPDQGKLVKSVVESLLSKMQGPGRK